MPAQDYKLHSRFRMPAPAPPETGVAAVVLAPPGSLFPEACPPAERDDEEETWGPCATELAAAVTTGTEAACAALLCEPAS